jgi:hypothetical protein
MAIIDVTELLGDADFVDSFSVIRRVNSVNNYGENVLSESTISAVGSIQPSSPDDMQRLPDSVRRRDAITVYSVTRISPDAYPDVVLWGGKKYQAQTSEDFGNYGAGYTKAICTLIEAGNGGATPPPVP